jgi:uncharacterized damage-inducible protein DinB
MPSTLQDFLSAATQKAADDLAAAVLRLPEDKRGWSPDGKARPALDQMAECAVLNGYTADLIQTQIWQDNRFDEFFREKAEAAAQDWETLHARLRENAGRVAAAIAAVPDDALGREIKTPWGSQTLAGIMSYPYWNMTYHQGQINYIASLLGCLE